MDVYLVMFLMCLVIKNFETAVIKNVSASAFLKIFYINFGNFDLMSIYSIDILPVCVPGKLQNTCKNFKN